MWKLATAMVLAAVLARVQPLALGDGCEPCGPTMVSRADWGARSPREVEPMAGPVPFVVIHHSYLPPACSSPADCERTVREVQDMHMDRNGWADVGYSFLVGGDSRVYVGRGWDRVGAHAPGYNNQSIGICVIGDWQVELPPAAQLRAVHELVALGVARGLVQPSYRLLGHRQTRPTECPGEALWREINSWPNFSPCPPPVEQSARPDYVPIKPCLDKNKTKKQH